VGAAIGSNPAGIDAVTAARRVRNRAELRRLLELVEPLEPRATLVAAGILAALERRRGVRVAVVDHQGATAGIVVWARMCADRWVCAPLTLQPGAAAGLARAIDASAARQVVGLGVDVDPLVSLLPRRRGEIRMPSFAIDPPIPFQRAERQPDAESRASTRMASSSDVRALTRCYEAYELIDIPTVGQLRRHLRRELRHGNEVLVVELDGEIVAANRMGARSRRYAFWGDATVLPEARGQGLMRFLTNGSLGETRALDLGFLGTLAPSNPKPVDVAQANLAVLGGNADEWVTLPLRPRLRFRGEGRLRKLQVALSGRIRRRRAIEFPAEDG
jgi:hypothetical protein